MERRRRVLVTGAGGFIGAHVASAFSRAGDDVLGVLSPRSPPASPARCNLRSEVLDLTDRLRLTALLETFEPDVIVNAAAAGARPVQRPSVEELIGVNVLLPVRLLEGMPPTCRLIQLGSMYEFANFSAPLPELEASPVSKTLYGWSKAAADAALARLSAATDRACLRARVFLATGSGEAPSRLIPSLVRAIGADTPVALTDGLQVRDLVHVSDLSDAIVLLAGCSTREGVFNVARGQSTTIRAIAEQVARVLGGERLLRFGELPRRHGEPDAVTAVVENLPRLGWRPRLDLEGTIRQAIRDLSQNQAE
jgi:nucleoside-diphosphate-sugar epimerase